MQIRVYKNEKNKLMYSIPGEKDDQFMLLSFLFMMCNAKELKAKLGNTMPELVIDCELDPNNSYDRECLESIEIIKREFEKVYR